MYKFTSLFTLLFCATLLSLTGCADDTASTTTDATAEPAVEKTYTKGDWLAPTTKDSLAQPVGVGLLADGNVVVFHRGLSKAASRVTGDVVAIINPDNGELVDTWGAGFFIQPHGMHVDWDGNLWLTDIQRQQVFKFTPAGELLLTLGVEGEIGDDKAHFHQPTDVAVAPDGNIFVTDGYGNRRVMKFSSDGTYLMEWGQEGDAPGEFKNPHAIDIDEDGLLYVSDRDNHRVQVFNGDGEYQREMPTHTAVYACIVREDEGSLLATDYLKEDTIVKGSAVFTIAGGENEMVLDRPSTEDEKPCRYHDLIVAEDGSLYLADLIGKEVYRYTMQ